MANKKHEYTYAIYGKTKPKSQMEVNSDYIFAHAEADTDVAKWLIKFYHDNNSPRFPKVRKAYCDKYIKFEKPKKVSEMAQRIAMLEEKIKPIKED